MRESILSIPINDVFEPQKGCPICRMHDLMEQRCIEYILGAAMMESDVRIETNRYGFCYSHLVQMMKKNNKLSLALMLKSHLDELEQSQIVSRERTKKDIHSTVHDCFICYEVEKSMGKLVENAILMYVKDEQFRKLYRKQESFCFVHYDLLCTIASRLIKRKDLEQFIDDTTEITRNYLTDLQHDIYEFATMFDYRNDASNIDESVKTCVERTIKFLTGEEVNKN